MASNLIDDHAKFDESIQKGFTRAEVYSNSLAVILAGYETVASSLQFIIFSLCIHPELQDELYQVARKLNTSSYAEVKDFKQLDAFIKEALRLYPPAPLNTRYCVETTEISENFTIEAGCSLVWSNLKFHMSDKIYSNPEEFDPTRWSGGNESNTLQDEAWFAFGQGPRACPGVRLAYYIMKIYLVTLMKNFEIVATENTPKVARPVVNNFKLVNEKPLMVKLIKRV